MIIDASAHQRRVNDALARWERHLAEMQAVATPAERLELIAVHAHNRHLILGGRVAEYERWEQQAFGASAAV